MKIAIETAGLDLALQILVGAGDEPHVDRYRLTSVETADGGWDYVPSPGFREKDPTPAADLRGAHFRSTVGTH